MGRVKVTWMAARRFGHGLQCVGHSLAIGPHEVPQEHRRESKDGFQDFLLPLHHPNF